MDHELLVEFDHIKGLLGCLDLKSLLKEHVCVRLGQNVAVTNERAVSIQHSFDILCRLHFGDQVLEGFLSKYNRPFVIHASFLKVVFENSWKVWLR